MRKITVAVVGLSFGMEFVPIYRDHPGINKVYVCDFSKDLLETAKMRYDIPEECCTEEFESLLSNPEIDAIHIVTPPATHADFSVKVLNAGKHCACTIPLGMTMDELYAVMRARKASGKNYMFMETTIYQRETLFIKEKLEKITGIETKLDNDANIIALGEAKYGAAKGSKSSVTVALGTGIGGGIYVNGMLISGFKGAGGEIGHMKIVKEGRLCGCGQRGCFEAYASATGLIREAVSRLTVNKQNLLYTMIEGNIAGLEAKDIFDAAKEGDVFSLDLVDYEAEYLAMGIANILNIINPETIVLGGGVALAGDILLNPLRKKLEKYALPVTLEDLKIVQGILGNEAGIKGAVGLFS